MKTAAEDLRSMALGVAEELKAAPDISKSKASRRTMKETLKLYEKARAAVGISIRQNAVSQFGREGLKVSAVDLGWRHPQRVGGAARPFGQGGRELRSGREAPGPHRHEALARPSGGP